MEFGPSVPTISTPRLLHAPFLLTCCIWARTSRMKASWFSLVGGTSPWSMRMLNLPRSSISGVQPASPMPNTNEEGPQLAMKHAFLQCFIRGGANAYRKRRRQKNPGKEIQKGEREKDMPRAMRSTNADSLASREKHPTRVLPTHSKQ